MLTLDDCIALCDLTEDEVHAIAAHEGIPELAAAEIGHYLVSTPSGELVIKGLIRDNIAAAGAAGDRMRVLALKSILRNYVLNHRACDERQRQALHAIERRSAA